MDTPTLTSLKTIAISTVSGITIGLIANYIQGKRNAPWSTSKSIYKLLGKEDVKNPKLPDDNLYQSHNLDAGELDARLLSNENVNFPEVFEIMELLLRYCHYKHPSTLKQLYSRLTYFNLISNLDLIVDQISKITTLKRDKLKRLAIFLLRNSSHRTPIKFAFIILACIKEESQEEILFKLSHHEEFTFYYFKYWDILQKYDENRLFELAKVLKGWGRIHSLHSISTTPKKHHQTWLITQGCFNDVSFGNTLVPVIKHTQLTHILQQKIVSPIIIYNIGQLLSSFLHAEDIDVKDHCPNISDVLELFVKHLKDSSELCLYNCMQLILQFLYSQNENFSKGKAVICTKDKLNSLINSYEELSLREKWIPIMDKALMSEDDFEFQDASLASQFLEIDVWTIYRHKLKNDSLNPALWFASTHGASYKRILKMVNFAEQTFCNDIQTPENQHQNYIDSYLLILQALYPFTGTGEKLLINALKSKQSKITLYALKICDVWKQEQLSAPLLDSILDLKRDQIDHDSQKVLDSILEYIKDLDE
ncbi:MAG: hypothetical protein KC646_08210 [Candidatus Cloacimonetes bacterium]|nr:hypothetical protein [Candidatus Cloacimonadota bacterium]